MSQAAKPSEEKLRLKIGSVEEQIWTQVAREAKQFIKDSKQNLVIQSAMLKLAEDKVAEEKRKV